ncbi:ABC transporter substrate-binding protein [uncultured Agrococcus sp.]|uniref:ABC transporter substrate-binding protein n=1 Tax=uncultured Agrococcus sp. TaxID=382258 RepID=UPI0025FD79E8|nr:ABC transporter substrate-binding protein [uncultured Agrococcus sp.]
MATSTGTYMHRAITRQLYILPTDEDQAAAATPLPDLATAAPEISSDGIEYSITLRDDAVWDTEEPRVITAEDAERGFKRLCNPARPGNNLDNYIGVIAGMEEYCDAFREIAPDVDSMKEYLEANSITGIEANGQELTITLEAPANDFESILTQVAVAPVPEEILNYLPDSPELRTNWIASGPYRILSYVADQRLELERNPSWSEESDDYREAYIDGLEVDMSYADAGRVQRLIESGEVDSYWNQSVPTPDLQRLMSENDPNLMQFEDGAVNPYIQFNFQSPNNDGALSDPLVRQAFQYAVNRSAVAQAGGGLEVKFPTYQALTEQVFGYDVLDTYATPDDEGDPELARELLAEAGYPDGITVNFVYATGSRYDAYAQVIEADLRAVGIEVNLIPTPGANVTSQFTTNAEATESGAWDITINSLSPTWVGNGARTMLMPNWYGVGCENSTTNFTCYSSDEVNSVMEQARTEADADAAAELWMEVDRLLVEDSALVPLITGKISLYRSDRLQNAVVNVGYNNLEPGLVWLDQ